MKALKRTLDKFYKEYDFKGRIAFDPIEFPHQYKRPEDIEVAGFIASCFAYGRVDLFKPVVRTIIGAMGESPYEFLLGFNPGKQGPLLKGIQYRFNRNADIICLLHVLGGTLRKYGSMESLFKGHYRESDADIGSGLAGMVDALLDTPAVCGGNAKAYGFLQFFPSPVKGSACKRMNLFLRWMVRDRDIDFGIWKDIPKNKLIIPLDTHIARIARCLGFTKRASQDWKMAEEITGALKLLDPEDPLKYDFALCHQGISGVCSSLHCGACSLSGQSCARPAPPENPKRFYLMNKQEILENTKIYYL